MQVARISQILISIGAICIAGSAFAIAIDPMIQQARAKALEGDREGAAALYHRVLEQDSNNMGVRNELAKLLVDVQVEENKLDPHSAEELGEWYKQAHEESHADIQ